MQRVNIEFLAKSCVFACVVSVGVFVAVRAAVARDGVSSGAPRSFLTVAGTLSGVSGTPSATFHFRRAGASSDACAPTVTITNLDPITHAFTVDVPIESCGGLLDGSDVTVTVDVGTSVGLVSARINPAPYAAYAGVAGFANAAHRSGSYGLTLSYDAASSGQLCIQCNGRPCSEENPGFVVFDSAPPDRITASACIRDGRVTGSDLSNHPFGTIRGVGWPEDRPFALYACRASAGVHFGLSPDPTKVVTPASDSVVSTSTTSGTSESDSTMFVWGGAAVSGNRCLRIGALRMRKDSGDRWTVSPLDAMDGIDQDADFGIRSYIMPPGQRGAPPDNYLHFDYSPVSSSWVLPTYRRIRYTYSVDVNGRVDGAFLFKNVETDTGTVPGSSTTTNMVLVLPYVAAPDHLASDRMGSAGSIGQGASGGSYIGSPFSTTFVVQVAGSDSVYFVYDERSASTTSSNLINPNHQGGANRALRGQFRYRAFPQ